MPPTFRHFMFSVAFAVVAGSSAIAAPMVTLMRTPDGGIQPQAAVDPRGTVHLIYFKGDPAAGDIFYVRRAEGADAFSPPVRVNTHPGSAVAMGTIRGAQLAVGKGGRVHVVWNGSKQAQPRGDNPPHDTPMLYARMNDTGTGFDEERNLIRTAWGLDGGGSVAADDRGNVYVLWHANPAADGEANRRVYLATSRDDGQSFAPEVPISPPGTGTCGCCGMKAIVDDQGRLMVMYRSASDLIHRDMYLLRSDDSGHSFDSRVVDDWEVARCPMSSAAMADDPSGTIIGWETADRVYFAPVDASSGMIDETVSPGPDDAAHPAVAINGRGAAIYVWTEGTGWNRGGVVGWRVFDAEGNPTEVRGRRDGVPVWSLASVFANRDGGFTILY